jgi:two-component system CheB/CheR fusion protein
MPQHAIETGLVDRILRVGDMPAAVDGYSRTVGEAPSEESLWEPRLPELLSELDSGIRHDFGCYKPPMLIRRVRRRMGLHRLTELGDYIEKVRQDEQERAALAADFLIHVTEFFRDPEVWKALSERVIAPLVAARSTGDSIRCWVVGCSSGEEAYSLAMLIAEQARLANKVFEVKVFASDAASRMIDFARTARYPAGSVLELPQEHLEAFFDRDGEFLRVKRSIRESVIFAPHDILRHPPFSDLDLITCRNLLMYLKPEMQELLLTRLHFGLKDHGTLLLGSAESCDRAQELFEPIWPYRRSSRSRSIT